MAYMNQERKQQLAPEIKTVLKKYKLKGSLSVRNHMTLVLNIKGGIIDFIGNFNEVCSKDHVQVSRGFKPITGNYIDVNPYHYKDHYSNNALKFLNEVLPLLNTGNHNNSDIMTDYFDVGWYVDVNIGSWKCPYILTEN